MRNSIIAEAVSTGCNYIEDIIRRGLYNAAVSLMDDELREQLHEELAPCSDAEFLTRYMQEHEKKYGVPFIV